MTPRQRIIVVVLVSFILFGNATNYYFGLQKATRLVAAQGSQIAEIRQPKISPQAGLAPPDLEEPPVVVTRAYNEDGSEHDLAKCKLIHINWATEKELQVLPGIGPVLAGRIIEARKQKYFVNHEDLLRVSGIGPKVLEKIYALICPAIPDVSQ